MAARFAPGDLLRMLSQVSELDADGRFRKSGDQRTLLEILLLRFAYLESTVSLEDVLSALGGRGAPPGNPAGGRPQAPDAAAARPTPAAPAAPSPVPRVAEPARAYESAPAADASRPAEPPRAPEPPRPPEGGRPASRPPSTAASGPPAWMAEIPPPDDPGPPESPSFDPGPPAGADGPLDAATLRRAWGAVMADAASVPPALRMMLRSARPSPGDAGQVRVEMAPGSLALEPVTSATNKRALEDTLGRRLGRRVNVVYVAGAGGGEGGGGGAPSRITAESARADRLERLAADEPLLRAAVQEWDLELVD